MTASRAKRLSAKLREYRAFSFRGPPRDLQNLQETVEIHFKGARVVPLTRLRDVLWTFYKYQAVVVCFDFQLFVSSLQDVVVACVQPQRGDDYLEVMNIVPGNAIGSFSAMEVRETRAFREVVPSWLPDI